MTTKLWHRTYVFQNETLRLLLKSSVKLTRSGPEINFPTPYEGLPHILLEFFLSKKLCVCVCENS